MALRKYFEVATGTAASLFKQADKEVERAQQESASRKRGKYNSYTPEQRANVGKYTAENGPANAAAHFTRIFGFKVILTSYTDYRFS